jgi:hypothetical protein
VVKVYFHPTFPRQRSQRRTTKWQAIGMHCAGVLSCTADKTIKDSWTMHRESYFPYTCTRNTFTWTQHYSTVPHAKCEDAVTINFSQHCRMLSNTQPSKTTTCRAPTPRLLSAGHQIRHGRAMYLSARTHTHTHTSAQLCKLRKQTAATRTQDGTLTRHRHP